MPAKLKSDPHLAIGHVLFMDVVGYSKLLVNEQREVVHQLNQVVRKTAQLVLSCSLLARFRRGNPCFSFGTARGNHSG